MGISEFLVSYLVLTLLPFELVLADLDNGEWEDGHATFYGDMSGAETMYGACGYGNLFEQGYGLSTAALSTALFNNGLACGSCFQLLCTHSQWCKSGMNVIHVTATNFCPPSYGPGAWCNAPLKHFDLSEPMFLSMAEYRGGIVPVKFRKVSCIKRGGIKFELNGNPYWLLVLVYNVGGAGDVTEMKIKGSKTMGWMQMSRNWGQKWQVPGQWLGQSMSFQVTVSDGRSVTADNVVDTEWTFGQSYSSSVNF